MLAVRGRGLAIQERSERYLMLRQAMMARRVLLLLDGHDEGGQVRAQIERHVTQVIAPQGHAMCTLRKQKKRLGE